MKGFNFNVLFILFFCIFIAANFNLGSSGPLTKTPHDTLICKFELLLDMAVEQRNEIKKQLDSQKSKIQQIALEKELISLDVRILELEEKIIQLESKSTGMKVLASKPAADEDDGFEDNDDMNNAAQISAGKYTNLKLYDDDWYKVYVSGGKDLKVSIQGTFGGAHLGDIDVEIFKSSGDFIVAGISGRDSETVYATDLSAGWYYIRLQYFWYNGLLQNIYSLQVQTGTNLGAGTAAGRVTDANSDGIGNLWVYIYKTYKDPGPSNWMGYHEAYTLTDSNGNYKISLPPKNYKIGFLPRVTGLNYVDEYYNNKFSFNSADEVALVSGQTVSGIDAQLDDGGLIRGRVTDESGNPFENAYARPYTSSGTRLASGRTDQDGYYNVFASPGNVKVHFYKPWDAQFQNNYIYQWYNNKQFFNEADLVAVQANQTTQNINAQLAPNSGFIQGKVTNTDGEGVEKVKVILYETSQVILSAGATDENGDYTFAYLPTGNFKIFFDAETMGYISEWYNNKATFAEASLVPVTAGQTTENIDVVLSSETSNEPPTIAITEPSDGAVASGQMDINTIYSDDYYQFNRFELWWGNEMIVGLDGDDIPRGGYETVLDTTGYSNGNHTIKASITDTVNQTAEHQITVNVSNPADYAPTVSITNPANGTTVSGTVSIQADAADDNGINKVEFYIDDTKIGEDSGSPYEYSWDTTLYSNGTHNIKAIAYDTINQDTEYQISVNVNNVAGDSPPTVTITNPGQGSESRGTVNIQADAADDNGITKVEFYLDGDLLATDTASPYAYSWDSTGTFNGNHTIKAIATDTLNQTAEDQVSIYLNNQVDEPPVVRILLPLGIKVVSGVVNIGTHAVDDNSVSKTKFYVDGVEIGEQSGGDCLFNWDTTSYDNTAHILKAEAYDSANQRSYKQRTVIVHNISGDQVPQVTQTTIASLPGGETTAVTANTTVNGTVNIQVTVSDDNGINKVEFYVDGMKQHTDTTSPYQYAWDTTQYSNGEHTIDVIVYDTVGQTVTSQETVNVDNGGDTAPMVSIESLDNESTVSGDVTIGALAQDDNGVSQVEFYINDSLKMSDTASPYQCTVDTTVLINGRHSIKAKAYDTASQTAEHQIYVTVANAVSEGVDVSITYPAEGAQVAGVVPIQVTAASDAGIETVEFYIDGTLLDEDTTYPYQYNWDTSTYYQGTHSIQVIAYDGENESAEAHIDVNVVAYEAAAIVLNRTELTFGCIVGGDAPQSQTLLVSKTGTATLNWTAAWDQTWLNLTPAFGTDNGTITVSVDPTGLSQGNYTGTISVSDPNASNSPQTVSVALNIYGAGASAPPFGEYATPTDGSTVSSSVPFTGWVLDDIGVGSVKIYRDPVAGEGSNMIYIGDAVFVEGARPDVETAYPGYPMNYQAGWGYMMLTNFLPDDGNGTFKIYAIAADVEGHSVTLGAKTVTVDNENAVKPFGAIDTPQQGGTAGGSNFRNQGWVLTPMPNEIPTDGSTINVYVDGVYLGHPTYNFYRPDIAALFPGYANSDGAHAYFDFDTTVYDNGVHTIAWTAEDNAGNTDGIGSRYFTIQNTSTGSSSSLVQEYFLSSGLENIPVNFREPVRVNKGYGKSSQSHVVEPDEKGFIYIKMKELERLVIQVSDESSDMTGYMVVGDWLRRLPVGSTLDARAGTFFWQTAPGFVGVYRLVFVLKDWNGRVIRKDVLIDIEPKK